MKNLERFMKTMKLLFMKSFNIFREIKMVNKNPSALYGGTLDFAKPALIRCSNVN